MITATETRASRLRTTISWLRQMKAALEIPARNNLHGRSRKLDSAVNHLRTYGIDPRI